MKNSFSQNSHSSEQMIPLPSAYFEAQTFPVSPEPEDDKTLVELVGVVKRRLPLMVGIATVAMTSTVLLSPKQEAEYVGNFKLLVEPINNDGNLEKLTDNNKNQSGLDYTTQIEVLKSPGLMAPVVKQLQVSYPEMTYDSLMDSLKIAREGETKIIEVSYQSSDPAQTKAVLDTVSKAYLKYSLEKRQTKLRQGVQYVNAQLPFLQGRVNKLQKALQIFRQQNNFNTPEIQAQQITTQASSLTQQRQALNQQLVKARYNYNSLQDNKGKLTALNSAQVYQQLLVKLRELDAQISGELARFQEDAPNIETLKDKRQRLFSLLQEEGTRFLDVRQAEATTELRALEVQSQELANAEKQLKQQLKELPVLTRRYTELQRELQVATDSLTRFLTTKENLQIEISQRELPWQLIQAPVKPERPLPTDTTRNLVLGVVASTVMAIGSGILIEKLDNSYHTVDAIKERLKLPLLGVIPFEKQIKLNDRALKAKTSPNQTHITENNYNNYSQNFLEALRIFHTNIKLLTSRDQPIRSLVVTSASSGDGKSTIAYHLAQIATAMGQRVLLVDADMRQPRIHILSEIENQQGLSNLISGNLLLEQVIQLESSAKELSILSSGTIPPDPTKLLSSSRMISLMNDFRHAFDLVIYDAPPLVGLADVNLLAPHTDGIVLVTRIHKTVRAALRQAMENLKMARINVLGLVVNG
ncbi:MAG: polysaccharide biosynthesis tyrosine autokinase [Calothrix sp. C42_A2020_038]|nr:polysaccharide biosynthesis tyrosine autokinase [Calothrix sp. C42_A2020_038]